MTGTAVSGASLRRYRADDEEACIALWLRTWQASYPAIDFTARLAWWRRRWRDQLVPTTTVVVAHHEGALVGFVSVDPHTLYLDQIVVAPAFWRLGLGGLLLAEAKRISPRGLDLDVNVDNARAVGFYRKHGFTVTGAGTNPISGRPTQRMSWR